MNMTNVIFSAGAAYAQSNVNTTPPANPDMNTNTGLDSNGVNPNTGDATGPGAIRDMGAAGTTGPQDGAANPSTTPRTPDPGLQNSQLNPDQPGNDASGTNTTQSAVGVPAGTAMNTDAGMAHVGLWAFGILLVAAFLVWAAMRARRQTSTTTTTRTATTRTASNRSARV